MSGGRRTATIKETDVASVRKQSIISPADVMVMPMEAITPGLWLSESLPAAVEFSFILGLMALFQVNQKKLFAVLASIQLIFEVCLLLVLFLYLALLTTGGSA